MRVRADEQETAACSDGEENLTDRLFACLPISQSRGRRAHVPVERLGMVSGTRVRKVTAKERKPRGMVYMERAKAMGGELKHMIKAGARMLRRIWTKKRGDDE